VVGGDKPEAGESSVATNKPSFAIPEGALWLVPIWLVTLGVFAMTPALLYVSALPSYSNYISDCGKLAKTGEENPVLLHIKPAGATQQATLFVDPLCPTCKAFHKRLVAEKVVEQLDLTLVLFPLDNECNWMLDRALHPGSCLVSKAVLCADRRAMDVLEWAYDNQEKIMESAKAAAGLVNVRAMIREKWSNLDACIDSKETKIRLEKNLHYIVDNKLPVSTPQFFLGDTRLCEEDSDIGLAFTLRKLAPNLRQP
jgi:protein-disulfide isomerase